MSWLINLKYRAQLEFHSCFTKGEGDCYELVQQLFEHVFNLIDIRW